MFEGYYYYGERTLFLAVHAIIIVLWIVDLNDLNPYITEEFPFKAECDKIIIS